MKKPLLTLLIALVAIACQGQTFSINQHIPEIVRKDTVSTIMIMVDQMHTDRVFVDNVDGFVFWKHGYSVTNVYKDEFDGFLQKCIYLDDKKQPLDKKWVVIMSVNPNKK